MAIISSRPATMRRMDKCFCNSGKRFKDCCGSLAKDRSPPHGVYIVPGALSAGQCEQIVDIARKSNKTALGIQKKDPVTGKVEIVVNSLRVAEEIDLADAAPALHQLVIDTWLQIIQPMLNREVEWIEQPGLVRYPEGGHCFAHADSDVFNEKTGLWERRYDRDYSMLIYLNGDYEGGYTSFDNFNFRYKPQGGDLLFFPSDQRYLHQAGTVTRGSRYVIVSFASLKGGLRSYEAPTAPLIMRA